MADKLSPLASVSETRAVLEAHGLATKKALGQHFLINDGVVSRICDTAGLVPGDCVLEVGPGIGTLTLALLKRAGRVVSVERDPNLPAVLAQTCAGFEGSFALIEKDALALTELDVAQALSRLGGAGEGRLPTKLVANLPYAVAATIVLDYLQRFDSLSSATVMVQSEVADRMAARPGTKDYGAYTIKLALYAQVAARFPVKPSNFFPPPRVDSAVIRLDRRAPKDREGTGLDGRTIAASARMADAAFANRRKTIANSAKAYFEQAGAGTAPLLPGIFERAHIDPRIRGEALAVEDFIELGKALAEACADEEKAPPQPRIP